MEIPLSNKDYEIKKNTSFSKLSIFWFNLKNFSGKKGGTPFILGLCIALYFGLGFILEKETQENILRWGANIVPMYPIQPFRFITAVFLHGGFLHLFFNMLSCYYLSTLLEKFWDGRKAFIAFCVSAIGANIVSFILRSLLHDQIVSVGASGGLFGFLGALIAFFLFNRDLSPTLKKAYLNQFAPLIILNLFLSFLPHIDMLVHLCGFIIGFMFGFFIENLPYSFYKQREGFWSFMWLASLCIVLSSFIIATVNYWHLILKGSPL